MSEKAENPKAAAGLGKLPLGLWPVIATAHGCLAMLDGGLKYGYNNMREAGTILVSTYVDAAMRHLERYKEGQERDPQGTHNLGHALACIAIILEAEVQGNLSDDRPSSGDKVIAALDRLSEEVPVIRGRYPDRRPTHYFIGGPSLEASPPPAGPRAPLPDRVKSFYALGILGLDTESLRGLTDDELGALHKAADALMRKKGKGAGPTGGYSMGASWNHGFYVHGATGAMKSDAAIAAATAASPEGALRAEKLFGSAPTTYSETAAGRPQPREAAEKNELGRLGADGRQWRDIFAGPVPLASLPWVGPRPGGREVVLVSDSHLGEPGSKRGFWTGELPMHAWAAFWSEASVADVYKAGKSPGVTWEEPRGWHKPRGKLKPMLSGGSEWREIDSDEYPSGVEPGWRGWDIVAVRDGDGTFAGYWVAGKPMPRRAKEWRYPTREEIDEHEASKASFAAAVVAQHEGSDSPKAGMEPGTGSEIRAGFMTAAPGLLAPAPDGFAGLVRPSAQAAPYLFSGVTVRLTRLPVSKLPVPDVHRWIVLYDDAGRRREPWYLCAPDQQLPAWAAHWSEAFPHGEEGWSDHEALPGDGVVVYCAAGSPVSYGIDEASLVRLMDSNLLTWRWPTEREHALWRKGRLTQTTD